jgi:hypothetical protein
MDWKSVKGVGNVALNEFTPAEVAAMTGLGADLQRVWRRRGQLLAPSEGQAGIDAEEVAAVAVRYSLSKFGFSPSDTILISREAAPHVLFYALLSDSGAADVRGPLKRIAEMASRFDEDERVAMAISGVSEAVTHLCSVGPPKVGFANDAAKMLAEERYPELLSVDLALIGHKLINATTKPLFLIDVSEA